MERLGPIMLRAMASIPGADKDAMPLIDLNEMRRAAVDRCGWPVTRAAYAAMTGEAFDEQAAATGRKPGE